ncbi:hypothetical protein, unlikely [Trypanosoma congolense IL3000]|uniref:Uncharacterized protein n=1 Tax=Trypanosoma congolense (strain IL3000) TaxID=1068625 RepID=F9WIX4_TRYCI|nr:hypothetical protein, unlikely [Trypanosoma congolense IL3000]
MIATLGNGSERCNGKGLQHSCGILRVAEWESRGESPMSSARARRLFANWEAVSVQQEVVRLAYTEREAEDFVTQLVTRTIAHGNAKHAMEREEIYVPIEEELLRATKWRVCAGEEQSHSLHLRRACGGDCSS